MCGQRSPALCRGWGSGPFCTGWRRGKGLPAGPATPPPGWSWRWKAPPTPWTAFCRRCAPSRRRWRWWRRSRCSRWQAAAGTTALPFCPAPPGPPPRWPPPTWPPVLPAGRSWPTRPTAGIATRLSTAPTADRGFRSCGRCPTTGPTPPWPALPCAPAAPPSTATSAAAATTPSRTAARRAGRGHFIWMTKAGSCPATPSRWPSRRWPPGALWR